MFSAIIPTHNRPQSLSHCLQNLEPICRYIDLKIIVVLDGCEDQSWDIVSLFDSHSILTIKGGGDLYWGGAIAMGMQLAFDDLDSDAVIWLNDDSTFSSEDILHLLEVYEQMPGHIIGGNLVAANLGDFPIYQLDYKHNDTFCFTHYLNGNFTLIPRLVYKTIGNLNSKKFPHFGDSPYIDKARKYGFKCLVATKSKVKINYDIIRHLPIFLQMLSFPGTYSSFLKKQLFEIKSKWFIRYRWNYTINKFQWKSFLVFPLIFLRDFTLVFMLMPLSFLPFKMRARLVIFLSKNFLRLTNTKLFELRKELFDIN